MAIRVLLLLLILLLCLLSALAAESMRPVVRLEGTWACEVDADGTASREIWAVALPHPRPVTLPRAWTDDPLVGSARVVWYARPVTFPAETGDAGVALVLEDAVGLLEVFLDGAPIATLTGNGLPRHVRLHGTAGSTHQLALRVDASALPETTRPAAPGLGPIRLEALPAARIEALLPLANPAEGTVTVRYRLAADRPLAATLRLELFAQDRKRPLARSVVTVHLPAGPLHGEATWDAITLAPWGPGATNLYRLRATLVDGAKAEDIREVPCGATEVQLTRGGLYLNGAPIMMKGLRLPGGMPRLSGATLQETIAGELALAQRAGYNAVMAEGAALPEELLEAADAMGIFVVGEVPATGNSDRLTPDFATAVDELGHHPSLLLWSWAPCGDGEREAAALRALDPLRPLLLRDPAAPRLYPPLGTGTPVLLPDLLTGGCSELEAVEDAALPVLAIGVGADPPTDCPLGTIICAEGRVAYTGEDVRCAEMRGLIERVRRARCALGYFVRPLPGPSVTGLRGASGTPTKAYTAALAANQPLLIALRAAQNTPVGGTLATDLRIINDSRKVGPCQLYRVVTTPEPGGTTTIARCDTFVFTGERLQALPPDAFPPVTAERPGIYRLQYVITENGKTLSSAQAAVEVPAA